MKEVGFEGDSYEGTFLPPGTRVGHDTWSVTHDKQLFGEDADVFRPERWLEADVPTVKEWKKRTELAFGAGRWQCAGKAVALMELNKVFVTVSCLSIFYCHFRHSCANAIPAHSEL